MEPDKFTFTDEEFIAALNLIMELDAPLDAEDGDRYIPFTSIDDTIDMANLDSLSVVVFFTFLSKLFGITEEQAHEFIDGEDFTIRGLKEFVMKNATQTFTYEEAEVYSRECF